MRKQLAIISNLMPKLLLSELLDYDLHDLRFEGNHFTWSHHRGDPHLVLERLDRFVASPSWMALIPSRVNYHILSPVADDIPIMIPNHACP